MLLLSKDLSVTKVNTAIYPSLDSENTEKHKPNYTTHINSLYNAHHETEPINLVWPRFSRPHSPDDTDVARSLRPVSIAQTPT